MADIQTLTKEKIKLDEPGMYDVIFINDNITTMEFVVKVLKQIFGKTPEPVSYTHLTLPTKA